MLSLGNKEKKNFKKIAASMTSKMEKVGGKAKKSVSSLKLVSRGKKQINCLTCFCQNKDRGGLDSLPESSQWSSDMFDDHGDGFHNEDPGVNSDDEDDMFQVLVVTSPCKYVNSHV